MWAQHIYDCLYLCIVCDTLVPEICVHPEVLCVLQYIDFVHMRDSQDTQTARTGATRCLPLRFSMKTGRWLHRHNGINGLSLLRQWSCSGPATCHCASWHWTYYSVCMLVIECCGDITGTADSYHMQKLCNWQLRLAPRIPWMHLCSYCCWSSWQTADTC